MGDYRFVGFDPQTPEMIRYQLLQMGLLEGCRIRITHRAPITQDPVAIQIENKCMIAIRQKDVRYLVVERIQA